MLRQSKLAASFILAAFLLIVEGAPRANAGSKLPDPIKAGVAEKLFRLDCGHSLANDSQLLSNSPKDPIRPIYERPSGC